MRTPKTGVAYVWCLLLLVGPMQTQEADARDNRNRDQTVPVATQWTLNAAGEAQKKAIRSVLLLYCPATQMKGTGFLLTNGLVVTNDHVVKGCTAEQVKGITPAGKEVSFRKMAADADVDLAALRPTAVLPHGLELGSDIDPALGAPVSTWGYPLIYNGPAPLLSVGYVAGYVQDTTPSGTKVRHLIVNGAFNPGNSGGPLLNSKGGRVVGVVVAKFHLYPPLVKQAIDVLSRQPSGMVYTGTDGAGNPIQLSEAQVVAMVLDQFYKTTQVMIGEAISVAELRAFLKRTRKDLL